MIIKYFDFVLLLLVLIIPPLRSSFSRGFSLPIGRNLPQFYRSYFLTFLLSSKIPLNSRFFLINSCILKINIKIN